MAKKKHRPVSGGKRKGKAKTMEAQVETASAVPPERGPRKVLVLDRPDGSGYIVMLDVPGHKQYVLQVPPEAGQRMMMEIFRVVVKYGVEYGAPMVTAGIAGGRKY